MTRTQRAGLWIRMWYLTAKNARVYFLYLLTDAKRYRDQNNAYLKEIKEIENVLYGQR